MTRDERQRRAGQWTRDAFGSETMTKPPERAARLLEEAVEFAQAAGVPEAIAAKIVGYVYANPPGEIAQEAGGVGLTLLAACASLGISADATEQAELARVLSKSLEHFRDRQARKHAAGLTPGIGNRSP